MFCFFYILCKNRQQSRSFLCTTDVEGATEDLSYCVDTLAKGKKKQSPEANLRDSPPKSLASTSRIALYRPAALQPQHPPVSYSTFPAVIMSNATLPSYRVLECIFAHRCFSQLILNAPPDRRTRSRLDIGGRDCFHLFWFFIVSCFTSSSLALRLP